MTDKENVIEYLSDGILMARATKTKLVHIDADTAEEILNLLKEQEPVAVYESKISRCACGNTVNRYWHPKFCGYCGKELMWY